jgi:fatty acid desaturase
MTATPKWKNYSLVGGVSDITTPLTKDVFEDEVEKGWFSCKLDRKAFKQLIRRSDGPALRDFALWLSLLAASGIGALLAWGSWWCVPFFAAYGVLYSAADHRHHELSHGTPFKSRWINDALFHLCAFMTLREGFYYRWSHTRHHTDTLIVGRDPEIVAKRPPDLIGIVSDLFFIKDGITQIGRLLRNATGDLTEEGKHFVPASERGKVAWASRTYLAIFLLLIAACAASASLLPAMFVVLPRFYGGPLSQLFNLTQHAGLDEDVHDHRLNTRTVHLNPIFSFLYANMNYHIEHHMFPMVPYYNLPKVHELIKNQCPPPYRGLWEAYKEIIPALIRQRKDPGWYIKRPLPEVATVGAAQWSAPAPHPA